MAGLKKQVLFFIAKKIKIDYKNLCLFIILILFKFSDYE